MAKNTDNPNVKITVAILLIIPFQSSMPETPINPNMQVTNVIYKTKCKGCVPNIESSNKPEKVTTRNNNMQMIDKVNDHRLIFFPILTLFLSILCKYT